MFERYTEKARRVVFFARYEASQFGSPYIETEHLLLGLLREDRTVALRALKTAAALESVRQEIEARATPLGKTSTSVDLPLSHESKRILAYGAEESERLGHREIGPIHLLLGMLREQDCQAAKLLRAHGADLEALRADATKASPEGDRRSVAKPVEPPASLLGLLAQRQSAGDITVFTDVLVGEETADVAVFKGGGGAPSTLVLRQRIATVMKSLEAAIAGHQFERARFYSDEERRLRAELRQLTGSNPAEDLVPSLCILMAGQESLSRLRGRADALLAAGAACVWILDEPGRRSYTVTAGDGLREAVDGVLRVAEPNLEIDWRRLLAP